MYAVSNFDFGEYTHLQQENKVNIRAGVCVWAVLLTILNLKGHEVEQKRKRKEEKVEDQKGTREVTGGSWSYGDSSWR